MVEAKAIANFVNVATGRGPLGGMENSALMLNNVFFAPRYVASRFQLLIGQPFFGGNARTRKLIAKEYARYLIGMAMVYSLGKLAGGETEEDPTSANFGKIRFGRTRLDPLSGISQATVFVSRLATGKTKSSISDRVTPIRGEDVPYGGTNVGNVLFNFFRGKLSPRYGTVVNVIAGENVVGEKVTLKSAMADLVVPLSFRDILETMQEQGVPKGTALSLLAIFGMGVQTYDSVDSKKSKK